MLKWFQSLPRVPHGWRGAIRSNSALVLNATARGQNSVPTPPVKFPTFACDSSKVTTRCIPRMLTNGRCLKRMGWRLLIVPITIIICKGTNVEQIKWEDEACDNMWWTLGFSFTEMWPDKTGRIRIARVSRDYFEKQSRKFHDPSSWCKWETEQPLQTIHVIWFLRTLWAKYWRDRMWCKRCAVFMAYSLVQSSFNLACNPWIRCEYKHNSVYESLA